MLQYALVQIQTASKMPERPLLSKAAHSQKFCLRTIGTGIVCLPLRCTLSPEDSEVLIRVTVPVGQWAFSCQSEASTSSQRLVLSRITEEREGLEQCWPAVLGTSQQQRAPVTTASSIFAAGMT